MKIQSMFQKDINRPINGVIKVGQDDDAALKQELGEYIITKELRRHFRTFFDNYSTPSISPQTKSVYGFPVFLAVVNPTSSKCCLTFCQMLKSTTERQWSI